MTGTRIYELTILEGLVTEGMDKLSKGGIEGRLIPDWRGGATTFISCNDDDEDDEDEDKAIFVSQLFPQ